MHSEPQNRLEPSGTVWNHLAGTTCMEPPETTWNRLEPPGTVLNRLEPSGIINVITSRHSTYPDDKRIVDIQVKRSFLSLTHHFAHTRQTTISRWTYATFHILTESLTVRRPAMTSKTNAAVANNNSLSLSLSQLREARPMSKCSVCRRVQ